MIREDLALYLVTDRGLSLGRDIESVVMQAVRGGVTLVQLREKEIDTREFIALGLRLKAALAGTGVPLLINDRVDVALAVDADGVHIGQSDMPYGIARRLLGHDKIIGLSVETMDEVVQANDLDVDYVAVSPVPYKDRYPAAFRIRRTGAGVQAYTPPRMLHRRYERRDRRPRHSLWIGRGGRSERHRQRPRSLFSQQKPKNDNRQ